jgi:hypothetical protein
MLLSAYAVKRILFCVDSKAYFLNSFVGTLLLGKIHEKLLRWNRKSFCQLYDILQGHIPFASFYAADVIAMQSRSFG